MAEALVIYILASADPERPHPEAANNVETVHLEEAWSAYMAKVGQEMTESSRQALVSLP